MWETREKSIKSLSSELIKEYEIVVQGFELIDEVIDKLNSLDNPNAFSRVSSLVVAKGRNLAQGILSMILDGLGQESGALLRPLVECIELLCYLHQKPERVELILSNKKPSAGKIAMEIEGDFEELRNYLNSHASHLSVSPEAMIHIISNDYEHFGVKNKQTFSEKVLKQNLIILFSILFFLIYHSANCLSKCEALSEEIAIAIDNWKLKGQQVIG